MFHFGWKGVIFGIKEWNVKNIWHHKCIIIWKANVSCCIENCDSYFHITPICIHCFNRNIKILWCFCSPSFYHSIANHLLHPCFFRNLFYLPIVQKNQKDRLYNTRNQGERRTLTRYPWRLKCQITPSYFNFISIFIYASTLEIYWFCAYQIF